MNSYLPHKRSRTQLNHPFSLSTVTVTAHSQPYLNKLQKSVSAKYFLPSHYPKQSKAQSQLTNLESTNFRLKKSKYTRFPKAEDFLRKPQRHPYTLQIQIVKQTGQSGSKMSKECFKMRALKVEHSQTSFFCPYPLQSSKVLEFSTVDERSSSAFLPKQTKFQVKKDEEKTIWKDKLVMELKRDSINLKQTRSTVNYKEKSQKKLESQDCSQCLNLSFQIEQLLGEDKEKNYLELEESNQALKGNSSLPIDQIQSKDLISIFSFYLSFLTAIFGLLL